jgi:hypothetical protein
MGGCFFIFLVYNIYMERKIAPVVKKISRHEMGNDFSYWQVQPYQARIDALEEIRREYHSLANLHPKDTLDVQPGLQRVYRIVKR